MMRIFPEECRHQGMNVDPETGDWRCCDCKEPLEGSQKIRPHKIFEYDGHNVTLCEPGYIVFMPYNHQPSRKGETK